MTDRIHYLNIDRSIDDFILRKLDESNGAFSCEQGPENDKNKHQEIPDSFDLTKRENEVLSCLVKGMSYKMAADVCVIGLDTVNMHVKNIYKKL